MKFPMHVIDIRIVVASQSRSGRRLSCFSERNHGRSTKGYLSQKEMTRDNLFYSFIPRLKSHSKIILSNLSINESKDYIN